MLANIRHSLNINNLASLFFNKAPELFEPIVKKVPYAAQKKLLLPILYLAFNKAIIDGDFDFLEGNWLKISITDFGLKWLLSYKNGRFLMSTQNSEISEDVSFYATGADLLLIAARKEDPDTLFFQRRLKIEGDTELGIEIKNLIDAIDLEELPKAINKSVNYLATGIEKYKPAETK